MKKSIFFIVIICAFLFPIISFAGNLKGPLVPCGRSGQEDCTLCDIFVMLQTIIDFITLGIFIFAPIFIAAGGIMILISADTPDRLNLGKSIIKNAIIGIVIALLAWTMVNELLIALAGSTTVGGKKTGKIFDWPWNDIKCEGGGVGGGGGTVEEGQYCVCEVPVYDLDPNTYPSQASVIGTNIKVTKLASNDVCKNGCVSGNFGTYCPPTLKQDKSNLYCSDESGVKSKRTCSVKIDRDPQCQISGGKCWSDPLECAATVTPGTSQFNSSYVKRCFINGENLCGYSSWVAGATTYCPEKVPPCTSDKPYTLYRFAQEKSYGEMDALKCSTYSSGDYSCRLNCEYNTCSGGSGTPSGDWRFQGNLSDTKNKQIADASTSLTNFLNCFYQKAPGNIGYISAITDKDIYNGTCDPQKCKKDTCTTADCGPGKACDHACGSCHYGGTCTSTKSYAVDFGDEENVCAIADAAKQCTGVNKIYGPQTCGGKVEDDNQHEDHVHVGVTNSCGCN